MRVSEWNIEDLRLYEKNPRINDRVVEAVARSLRAFGFRQPIVVDADVAGITAAWIQDYLAAMKQARRRPKTIANHRSVAYPGLPLNTQGPGIPQQASTTPTTSPRLSRTGATAETRPRPSGANTAVRPSLRTGRNSFGGSTIICPQV